MEKLDNVASKTLKILGLSSSEREIYKILVENDFLLVSDIAKYSGVPRTKTYEILKSLELKGLIQKTNSQPAKFKAKEPRKMLKKLREELIQDTEKGLEVLQESWEHREQIDEMGPITVYYGTENYYKVFKRLEQETKSNIFMLFRYFTTKEEIQIVKSIIRTNNKKGITLEVVLHPDTIDLFESETLEYFKNTTKLTIAPIPIRVIIVDNKELIMQIPTPGIRDDLDPEDIHQVIIRLPDLVQTMETSIRYTVSQIHIQ